MKSIEHIGQEFFRFEMATAGRGAPCSASIRFNQTRCRGRQDQNPRVDCGIREIRCAAGGKSQLMSSVETDLYTDDKNAAELAQGRGRWRPRLVAEGPSRAPRMPATMLALLAYVERNAAHIGRRCRNMRLAVRDQRHVATCRGNSAPRFLHSTGPGLQGRSRQRRVSLQITADDVEDLPVPDQKASFGNHQGGARRARRFRRADRARARRALRVHLKGDLESRLESAQYRDQECV